MYLKRALSLRWHVFLYSMNCPYCLKKKNKKTGQSMFNMVQSAIKTGKTRLILLILLQWGKHPRF